MDVKRSSGGLVSAHSPSEPPALDGAPDATIRPRSGIERPCFGIAPVLRLFAFPVGALVSGLVNAALIATCVLGHDSLLGLGANELMPTAALHVAGHAALMSFQSVFAALHVP